MSTTTEHLILALAIELYGIDNRKKIEDYISYNGVFLSNWHDIYRNLKTEALTEGYSNVVDYCEDMRYKKAHEYLQNYTALLYGVLDNSIDPNSVDVSSDESYYLGTNTNVIDDIQITAVRKDVEISAFSDISSRCENSGMDISNQIIEPKNINSSIVKPKPDEPKNPKDKKRYYAKLDDDSKNIDDYLDFLDSNIYAYQTTDQPMNRLIEKYPPVISQKSSVATHTILENITNPSLKSQYEAVISKLSVQKKQDKDKTMWKNDTKVVIEYIMLVLGHEKQFGDVLRLLETKSVSTIIVNILLVLQDIIMGTNDKGVLYICQQVKRGVIVLSDYYRK